MKSPTIPALMVGAVLLIVSSCATVPTEPLASGELRLLKMDVPQKEDLRERLPFVVNIGFEADGTPEIVTACFFWSGQGPYCSKVTNVTYGAPGTIKVHLRPRNPGPYALESYIVYMRDGKTQSTNVVGTHIRVLPQ
ncbi:MAG TPA: hypothetical protein VLK23_07150 [Thermodesulfobacteriota bacterium]|nr:hypothetical protein [Thermodesulfobacteriota bacterium]